MKNKTLIKCFYVSLAGILLMLLLEDQVSNSNLFMGIFAWGWIISSVMMAHRLKKIVE